MACPGPGRMAWAPPGIPETCRFARCPTSPTRTGHSLGPWKGPQPKLKQVLGSHAWQETLRRVDQAFQAFCRRVRAGEKPGFPRYKSRKGFVGLCYPDPAGWELERKPKGKHRVSPISHLGAIKARGKPRQWGEPRRLVLTRTSHGWYATTLRCQLTRKGGSGAVGIDRAVCTEAVATLSDGARVKNPRFLLCLQRPPAQTIPAKARQSWLDGNKRAVARLHRKVANQRDDLQHKLAAGWVAKRGSIATEALKAKGMTARGGEGRVSTGGCLKWGSAAFYGSWRTKGQRLVRGR